MLSAEACISGELGDVPRRGGLGEQQLEDVFQLLFSPAAAGQDAQGP